MYLLVLVLYSSFYGCCSGVPEIKLYVIKQNDSSISCPSEHVVSPKLTLDKPFQLSVHSDVEIHDGTCYYTDGKDNVYINHFTKQHGGELIFVPKEVLTPNNWSKYITCELYASECTQQITNCKNINGKFYNKTQCKFSLDIRNPGLGYLAVNEEKVEMYNELDTNQTVDTYGYYNFFEGQSATVTCHCVSTKACWVQLIYINGNETRAEQFTSKMYIKFTADKHGSFIDCNIANYDATRSLITRIFFLRKDAVPDLGFQVNGLILSPLSRQQCEKDLCYQYEYYEGEHLTVQSLKNEEKYMEILYCVTDTESIIPESLKNKSSISFSTVLNKTQNTVLEWIVNTKNGSLQHISLRFVPNTIIKDYIPLIIGLSMANVSLMFNSSTVKTIYYEYDDKTALDLKCLSNASEPKWNNNDEVEISTGTPYSNTETSKYHSKPALFKLRPDKESSVISCKAENNQKKYTTEILIHKKIYAINDQEIYNRDENSENSGTSAYPDDSIKAPHDKLDEESEKSNDVVIGTSIVVLLLLLIVTVVIIRRLTKKKLQRSDAAPTSIEYNNLQNQNEVAAARQWNEVQYAAPNDSVVNNDYAQPYVPRTVDELYTRPVPKNERNGQPNQEDPAYASVGELGPTYAQALPKSQRPNHGVQVLPTRNGPMYAELMLKTGRPNDKIVETENPYTEVQKRENLYEENAYAEPNCGEQTKGYANVFDGQKYVNTNSKEDYVAPAYCEINKIKK